VRADKSFGAFLKQRIEGASLMLTRRIPAPGMIATRHGATGGWTFAIGDGRGTRFVTSESGRFVQGTDYQPFGEASFPTNVLIRPQPSPGSTTYTSEQWNGGDLIAALGVVKLGARIYDPVIGRFLSRDPIISAGSPYTFANNDPINFGDPTGLSPEGRDENPVPPGPGDDTSFWKCNFDCGSLATEVPTSLDRGLSGSLSGSFTGASGRASVGGAGIFSKLSRTLSNRIAPVGSSTSGERFRSDGSGIDCSSGTCFAIQPTVADYTRHYLGGSGWPVYRLGLDVNLFSYPVDQFNAPAGTKIKLDPGTVLLAKGAFDYLLGPSPGGTSDAFIYGHIKPSTVLASPIRSPAYAGVSFVRQPSGRPGLIQLSPDLFHFDTDYDDRVGRDVLTDIQHVLVAGGKQGVNFETIFLGPTLTPYQ
jgi:RHS repeat-associated protein